MTRDTLYLLVIPNHARTKLVNANIIYAKQVSDIPVNKKSHTPLTKKSISENEYNYTSLQYMALIPVKAKKVVHNYAFSDIIKSSIDVSGQPPEVSITLS